MALPPLGCQLIIFGGHFDLSKDNAAIYDALKSAGYDAIEGGADHPELYHPALERGLKFSAAHIAIAGQPKAEDVIAFCRELGSADVCNSGILKWGDLTLADYQEGIDALNALGKALRAAGIHLHYHNHDFEFHAVEGGKTGMDLLLDGLDPAAVDLCVDVAWVQKGGLDPQEFLVQHKDRIGYLHLKDYDADGWCELGRGEVDLDGVITVLPGLPGVRWAVIEQDSTTGDPIQNVTNSRRFLKEEFGY